MKSKFAILAIVAVLFAGLLTSPTHSQKKKPVLDSSPRFREWNGLPLELKKGVKVQISGSLASQSKSGPVTVKEVIGHWVYLEGKIWVGNKTEKEGWVNFNQIGWFQIVKEEAKAKAKK